MHALSGSSRKQAACLGGRTCHCSRSPSVVSSSRSRPSSSRRKLSVNALLKPAEGVPVSWSQTTDEVIIKVPVGQAVRGKDVEFEVHPTRLRLAVQGDVLLEGSLTDAGAINVDNSFWVMETDDDTDSKYVQISLGKATMGYESWDNLLVADLPDTSITHRVLLDVQVGERLGRLVLGLYGNVVPKTVENFRALITGDKGQGKSGSPLHFRGSPFHRIIPGFMAQGGDITLGNGMGGESIYGESFADENFKLKHSGRGVLAMANAGPNTNNSQFYITFTPTPHLDGKHVVFGTVEAGWSTLMMMEGAGSDAGNTNKPVTIVDCRELDLSVDPEAAVEEFAQTQREQQMAAEFAAEFDAAKVSEKAKGARQQAVQQQQQQEQQQQQQEQEAAPATGSSSSS